ncbi:MAG: hypothetical protein IJY10_08520 [Lachnospiraceae bacterium]|nr:hypothetical protein [Lachnospiraceae bacterium]
MATKLKRLLALFVTIVCLASSLGAYIHPMEANAATKQEINNHKLIAENKNYALYMNEEYLSIIVYDKVNDTYMESAVSYDDGKNNDTWLGAMRSALVLTMIHQSIDTMQADLINDDVEKEITYKEDGFTAKVFWKKYQLGMTLEVTLNEDGVTARIPDESIIEKSDAYYIGTISMYPYMGSSYLDSKEGYMFIPDGNGALIYLDDKEGRFNSGYSAMVYGKDVGFVDSEVVSLLWGELEMVNDSNKVFAPVYGMAYTQDQMAYLAVIEEGAERTSIEASPNGANIDYNRIHAKFIERRLYTQPTSNNSTSGSFKLVEADRSHSDLQIRFLFLNGENANYCGMANAYRQYLIEKGDLAVREDGYRTRVDFLGTDRETWLMGTKAIVMTTVEDIQNIYADLESQGVTDLFSVYKGWQKGGIFNLPITSYKADSKIGGTKDLTKLMQDAQAKDIQFYLYNEALHINPDEQNATFNIVKKVNKKKYEESTYKDVYETLLYLTPARSQVLLNKFMQSYGKQGVNNLALAGITNNLYSYSYSSQFYTRYDCADTYAQTLAQVDEQMNLVLEQPYAYLWKYTESFMDMPMYNSSYIYEDADVPFMSIVLKGVMPVYSEYVNFEANKQEFFLKLIETGTYPSFYITQENSADLLYTNSCDIYSSQYSVYRDTILEYAFELKEVNQKVAGAHIVAHEILGNGITVVTYDNGVQIYINYASTSQKADGLTLEAMSYKVVE